jgi:hypothetical protein
MHVAKQVHRVREIAARMPARSFEKGIQVGVASASLARDARELGFGNADLTVADGPVNRHSSPLVLHSGEALLGSS